MGPAVSAVRDLAGTRKFDEQKETEKDMRLKLIVFCLWFFEERENQNQIEIV